jgi:hypothetical protein
MKGYGSQETWCFVSCSTLADKWIDIERLGKDFDQMNKKTNPLKNLLEYLRARKDRKKRQKKEKEDNPYIYPLF